MLKNMKNKCLTFILLFCFANVFAQTSDDKFRVPLKDVLEEIRVRYQVRIRDPDKLVKDQQVAYAGWRFRPDAEKTLESVLATQNLTFRKEGDKKYKIKSYEYYRRTVEEGKEQTEFLLSRYNDVTSWEKRKADLKQCMIETLGIQKLPRKQDAQPFFTGKRKMNGYTIENFALETLPGYYVCASIYKPQKFRGKVPVILCPNGHFLNGRYGADQQMRCAMLARMGAITVNYDLFAWGESLLQFREEDHKRSIAMVMQVNNTLRILDYLTTLKEADAERVGITGGSGGGSHTMLVTAIDNRIKVSVPVVMLSCYFSGGCPCESGIPVHLCGQGTNNVEVAGMTAPRPQLVISDGKDWTDHVPEIEFPALQKIYGFYDKKEMVQNAHFPEEGHDYGISKRLAMYEFMAKHLGLNIEKVKNMDGNINESNCTIEEASAMYVFGNDKSKLPDGAIKSIDELENLVKSVK